MSKKLMFALSTMLILPSVLFAIQGVGNEDVPSFFNDYFSEQLLALIAMVVGAVKLLKNALPEMPTPAKIAISLVAGVAIGELQFAAQYGPLFAGVGGLLGGLAASGLFAASKKVRKK